MFTKIQKGMPNGAEALQENFEVLEGAIKGVSEDGALQVEKLVADELVLDGVDVRGSSDWEPIELTNDFKIYDDLKSSTPMVKVHNGIATVKGAIQPTKTIPAGASSIKIGRLPAKARFNEGSSIYSVQQGSGYNNWFLTITQNGDINLARYSNGSGYVDATTSTWFPFTVTYAV